MTVQTYTTTASEPSLVDLLDRLLGKGVVITGDIVVSLAEVDLVRIQLSAVIGSVREEMGMHD
jgi:hypothetical protein